MNVDGALDAFYAENDFLNLKTALKAWATGTKGTYLPDGLCKVEDMEVALQTEDTGALEKEMREAIEIAKALVADEKGVDPAQNRLCGGQKDV